jgi:hypothetical protein
MTSSIFAEAAATALLMQQRSLEAAMLENFLTLQNAAPTPPPPIVGAGGTADPRGGAGDVGATGAETLEDSSLVAQAGLARAALEASMNLRSTLNQQAERCAAHRSRADHSTHSLAQLHVPRAAHTSRTHTHEPRTVAHEPAYHPSRLAAAA